MKKEMKDLAIYHLEDEEHWATLLGDALSTKEGLSYHWLEDWPDNFSTSVDTYASPGIFILDLQLTGGPATEDKRLEITDLIPLLQERGFEIFILSGFVSPVIKKVFNSLGITENNIIEKAEFDLDTFVAMLLETEKRIKGKSLVDYRDRINFLHLSDIHFGQDKNLELRNDDVRNEILLDVARLVGERGAVDKILIVGDVAYSGARDEYNMALEWLVELTRASGCNLDSVRVIPGNHDVDWSRITDVEDFMVRNLSKAKSPSALNNLLKAYKDDKGSKDTLLLKLENYQDFADNFSCKFASYDEPYWTEDLFLSDGPVLKLCGLNTALFSGKNDSEGSIVLTDDQYLFPRAENLEYIMMMHHPAHWFKNRMEVLGYFDNRAKIILSGHDHQLKINKCVGFSDYERLEVFSGATNPPFEERGDYRYNYFSVGIDPDSTGMLLVDIWPRMFSNAKEFVADTNLVGGDTNKTFALKF